MIANRREMLATSAKVASLMLASGLFGKAAEAAGPMAGKGVFEAKTLAEVARLLGYAAPAESRDVTITAADIAENGAVVQMAVASTLSNIKQLMLLVEKNPAPLVAVFNITPEVEPSIKARAKMGQSSNVFAVAVTNDNKVLFAQKEVKVTLGGCGG